MPASDDLFSPGKGGSFVRSYSGLAHSDREIQEMREWIDACDRKLPGVFSWLADCLSAASDCMAPVRPEPPTFQGPCPENALRKHAVKIEKLKAAVENLSRAATFPKNPFYERHFIPFGGMPSALNPRDFDGTRNNESVYDEARAAAIKKVVAAKEEAVIARANPKKPEPHEAAMREYIENLPAKSRRQFQSRLASADFSRDAAAVIDAASHCIAAAACQNADKLAEGEKLLAASAARTDLDLYAMAIYYLENAQEPVRDIIEESGMSLKSEKKALADIAKLRQRFDAASEASQADKKPRRKKSV